MFNDGQNGGGVFEAPSKVTQILSIPFAKSYQLSLKVCR